MLEMGGVDEVRLRNCLGLRNQYCETIWLYCETILAKLGLRNYYFGTNWSYFATTWPYCENILVAE